MYTLAKEHFINAELLRNIIVFSHLGYCPHTLLNVLRPMHNLEQTVHLRIHRVLEHNARQQVRQAFTLGDVHACLYV